MEQKKKSSKQWRREIIADVERREAEKKKEKWRIRRCWLVIYGSTFSFSYGLADHGCRRVLPLGYSAEFLPIDFSVLAGNPWN